MTVRPVRAAVAQPSCGEGKLTDTAGMQADLTVAAPGSAEICDQRVPPSVLRSRIRVPLGRVTGSRTVRPQLAGRPNCTPAGAGMPACRQVRPPSRVW